MAQVDRAIVALDEFLAQAGAGLRRTEEGSEFEAGVGRLRLNLLQLRQRIARQGTGRAMDADAPGDRGGQPATERPGQRPMAAIVRGTSPLKVPGLTWPAQAVSRLRAPCGRNPDLNGQRPFSASKPRGIVREQRRPRRSRRGDGRGFRSAWWLTV